MSALHDADAWIGRTFGDGRYEVLRLLGEGGMGAVFAARDAESGGDVALKVLLPELAAEERHLARFRREAEVMGLLSHPHVVRALGTGVESDGTPWIAMELIEGETLSALARREASLPVERAVGMVRQVVAALMAAHEVGVVHRDLKPANVMLVNDGELPRVKVVDFGIARFVESATYQKLTMTGMVVGTPSYMAPEQAFGDRVDHRADIYAVGAILHALLTGSPPFGSGKSPDILPRLLSNTRTRLTETRRDLGDIVEVVERCLEPEPEQRYQSASDLDAALAPFDAPVPRTISWTRPPTMQSLVLPPDPVLDAPRPRKRPRTRIEAPAANASIEAPAVEEAGGRSRMPLIAAAFIAAVAVSAIGVYASIDRAPPVRVADGVDPPAAPPAVQPVASPDGGAAADATVDAEPDAAPDREASEQPTPRVARRVIAPPADVALRIEVHESFAPPTRFYPDLRSNARRLTDCIVGMEALPSPLPQTFDVRFTYHGALASEVQNDAPPAFDHCVNRWAIFQSFPGAPAGDSVVHLRARLEAAAAGDGSLTLVDRTDWASRQLTPPRVRVTFQITESDVAVAVVSVLLVGRRAALAACLEEHGDLESPPPFTGTAAWARIRERVSPNFRMDPGTPRALELCLGNTLVRSAPIPTSDAVRATIRVEAAEQTSIRVLGP